jgi:hypothetical protein
MRRNKIQISVAGVFPIVAAMLLFTSCSINVQKEKDGQDKKVDIRTPLGGIHVDKQVNPDDVGIVVYPGATLKAKNDGEDKSANVNISGFGYGLKVVALEYESNDSPAKVIAFYQDKLRRYGDVLVCHTSNLHVNAGLKKLDENSHPVTCEGESGHDVELKVGTQENQHIVAVEPTDGGSKFSLVYVRAHGKEAEI